MMRQKSVIVPLGIVSIDDVVFFYQKETDNTGDFITLYTSEDGEQFTKSDERIQLLDLSGQQKSLTALQSIHCVREEKTYYAIFQELENSFIGTSQDGITWQEITDILKLTTKAVLVPEYTHNEKHLLYWGDTSLYTGFSTDNINWTISHDPVFEPHLPHNQTMILLNTFVGQKEVFVVFAIKTTIEQQEMYSLSVAIFQKGDPKKVAWRLKYPFWISPEMIANKQLIPVGIVDSRGTVRSYWYVAGEGIVTFTHGMLSKLLVEEDEKITFPIFMQKADSNPILAPNPEHRWESEATFNPAALYEDDKVHLLYRAVGEDSVSTLGYAVSRDGITVDETLKLPAYVPRKSFEGAYVELDPKSPFASGPGFGGCEDPRLTRIDDKIYLTYVAHNGWKWCPRVAMSSISVDDFLARNWNWSEPVLISQPNIIDKNACIFPEKIGGKYAIMHRVFPYILVDFVDSLDFDGSTFLKGEHRIAPRTYGWDSRKVGAGPPPLKTKDGWLLIYHAVDDKDDGKYHIGAMLLDKDNPLKVLHRSVHPIISPTNWYENNGHKAGVVYPCGAVIKNNMLHVYYGGADKYVCVATTPLNDFLYQMEYHDNVTMNMAQFRG